MKTTEPANIFYTNPPFSKNPNYYNNYQQPTQSTFPVRPSFQNNYNNWNFAPPTTHNQLDICGKTKTSTIQLIANGNDAKTGDYPWIGAVFLREKKTSNAKFVCGATLISKNLALTGT